MPSRIEDYALIGDCHTAALVSRAGSIDWLCLPRFDSDACFAALLGGPDHGRWLVAPTGEVTRTERAYRDGTLVLDTTFHTASGSVTVTDCMPFRERTPRLVRVVRGVRGHVRVRSELVIRFDFGSTVPWVRRTGGGTLSAIAGPHALLIQSDIPLRGENLTSIGEADVAEGQTLVMAMSWHPAHVEQPRLVDPCPLVDGCERAWREWAAQCTYDGPWRGAVLRSLITLKALTHAQTGGIVAAPTTSLPEALGGVRNWDYRYCWIRDATFTLMALAASGFRSEAEAWREWMLRAAAGEPSKLQIMYAIDGTRRLQEWEVDWLPGYEGSRPVRVGNDAFRQRQLDVYGELLDAMHQCYSVGLAPEAPAWNLQRTLLDFLETSWTEPDDGIWEVRGPRRDFTHSKVMAWVAFDRAVKSVERSGLPGPVERWRAARDRIHEDVCAHGFDPSAGTFVQSYGSESLDASLLMIPLVGFLPAGDPRVRGTVRAIEQRLVRDGFVRRYDSGPRVDGLPEGEGAFLPCTFWLADNWALQGRHAEARALFERLLEVANDLGLLAEEYDTRAGRLVGNFPQAFSHVSMVNTAWNLARAGRGPAHRRHG